jgi:hypothetical protein
MKQRQRSEESSEDSLKRVHDAKCDGNGEWKQKKLLSQEASNRKTKSHDQSENRT